MECRAGHLPNTDVGGGGGGPQASNVLNIDLGRDPLYTRAPHFIGIHKCIQGTHYFTRTAVSTTQCISIDMSENIISCTRITYGFIWIFIFYSI